MGISDIVSVTITAQTVTPSRLGFGTALIARLHTVTADVVAEYSKLKEITDAGFPVSDPATLIATKIFSQSPAPASVKIGKRTLAFTQLIHVIPINITEGYTYAFDVRSPDNTTVTTITYTVLPASSVAIIVAALQALINAIPDLTAADATTHVTCTADNPAELFDYVGFDEPANFSLVDKTVDPGIATDLAAFEAADADGWYALLLDSNSQAEVLAAAAWIEARTKIFLTNTTDSEVVDLAVTDDVMSDLQAAAYVRTAIIFSQANLLSWAGAAWAGNRLPSDPGSSTWAFNTLAGVSVDSKLTGGQATVIQGKGGNTYRRIGGVNIALFGITSGGEYIDITRFIDWLQARMQERVFGTLVNAEKVPYTDGGVDLVRSDVTAQLEQGITVGGLAESPAPTVSAPKVADIDPADKGNRILPDVTFQATLAGAIHQVQIDGVLSV